MSTAPKDLAQLTRTQVLARITMLVDALDTLHLQAKYDKGLTFPCVGAMKVCLIGMENEIRARDKRAEQGEPIPTAVLHAMVGRTR